MCSSGWNHRQGVVMRRQMGQSVWKTLVVWTFLLFGLVALCPVTKAAPGQKAGWVLQQNSDYVGSQVIYLSPEGMKLVTRVVTTIILSPSQRVIMYNDKNKTYYESTYEMWKKQFPGHPEGTPGRTIRRGQTGTVAGIPATQYFFENPEGGKRRVTEEYWTAADSSIPPQLSAAMSRVSDLPPNFGIPLRIFVIKPGGNRVTALDTTQCNRTWVPSTIFNHPGNYRKVEDPVSLVLDAQKQ